MIVFPKWTNRLKYGAGLVLAAAPVYAVAFFWYVGSPRTTDVGYAPVQ
ncbi:cytochrome C, partial [Candidatus Poribacteria bacterium]|nr:cytochrome C [Candidatus Poribacteria bacterium]